MKMRPRNGGNNPNQPRRNIVDHVYENFKPISEWRREDDHDSLLLYLPGFRKEFIKVAFEDPNILRVGGERPLTGNKWNRFYETFEVPETCKMSEIRAKFVAGNLTVTMPRKPSNPPTTNTTTAGAKPHKPMKTAKQNTDSAKPSSSALNSNLPPQLRDDGLQLPLTGDAKSYDEEKPDQKPLDRVEGKEPLVENIIKTKMSKNNNGIIAKLKEYYKGVVKGLAMGVVATPAAVVAVVAIGVYVYYAIGASGKGN